jgi:transcriptional regulator GlxA family with amidase domain
VSPRIQATMSYLQDNLHRTLTLADIAQSVELSSSRLCSLFKTQVGVSPIQYLKKVRLERARELLETSFVSVKVLAAGVGYSDCTHFMRDFKKAYGSTPSQACIYKLQRGRAQVSEGR